MTDMQALLIELLGEPTTAAQEDMLYFFGFFLFVFVVSCVFDLIVNITKL